MLLKTCKVWKYWEMFRLWYWWSCSDIEKYCIMIMIIYAINQDKSLKIRLTNKISLFSCWYFVSLWLVCLFQHDRFAGSMHTNIIAWTVPDTQSCNFLCFQIHKHDRFSGSRHTNMVDGQTNMIGFLSRHVNSLAVSRHTHMAWSLVPDTQIWYV